METMCDYLDSLNDDRVPDRQSVQNIANLTTLTASTLSAMYTAEIPNQGQATNLGCWVSMANRVDRLASLRILTTIAEETGVDSGTWHPYDSSHNGGRRARGYEPSSKYGQGSNNQYSYNSSTGGTRFSQSNCQNSNQGQAFIQENKDRGAHKIQTWKANTTWSHLRDRPSGKPRLVHLWTASAATESPDTTTTKPRV